jgi:hypothetical protein
MTWGKQLYFPSEGRHAEDIFAQKIRWLWPGVNLWSWVPEASMLTTRPPKLLPQSIQFNLYVLVVMVAIVIITYRASTSASGATDFV